MTNHSSHISGEAELRLQLRGLSKEREVDRDLWPDIQAAISHSSQTKSRKIWPALAMAASLAFVAVLALPLFSHNAANRKQTLEAQVVSTEVKAMDTEYQGALKEFVSVEVSPEIKAQLQILDDSARKIRQALNENPQATYLIPMLRRTYLQRLQLTRRAFASNLA